jgi:hypothetical protein
MKRKTCQAKSLATNWDELIDFAKAKLKEMEDSLKYWQRCKERGEPFILSPEGNSDAKPAA